MDGHGDVTALINVATKTVDATYYYDAFGNILLSTGSVNNSITYAGYQYDDETGYYYLNARMYDPKVARFLQEDTYRGNPNDPLSLNLYTYSANNPIRYYDPSGHFWEDAKDWLGDRANDVSEGFQDTVAFTKVAFGVDNEVDRKRFDNIYYNNKTAFDSFYDDWSFTVNHDYEVDRGFAGEVRERLFLIADSGKDMAQGIIETGATAVEANAWCAMYVTGIIDEDTFMYSAESYNDKIQPIANGIVESFANMLNFDDFNKNTVTKPFMNVFGNAGTFFTDATASYSDLKPYSSDLISSALIGYGGAKSLSKSLNGIKFNINQGPSYAMTNGSGISNGMSIGVEITRESILQGIKDATIGASTIQLASTFGNGNNEGTNPPGRSDHANIRRQQGRPVSNARGDAQNAKDSDILVQPDDGRWIVRGQNGRIHVFEANGEHVTTFRNSSTNTLNRIEYGTWDFATLEEIDIFRSIFGN